MARRRLWSETRLRSLILPAGFFLLIYSLVVDQFRNPAIFSGAITLITLPVVHKAATGNGNGDDKKADRESKSK